MGFMEFAPWEHVPFTPPRNPRKYEVPARMFRSRPRGNPRKYAHPRRMFRSRPPGALFDSVRRRAGSKRILLCLCMAQSHVNMYKLTGFEALRKAFSRESHGRASEIRCQKFGVSEIQLSEIQGVRNSIVRNSTFQKFSCQKFNVSE